MSRNSQAAAAAASATAASMSFDGNPDDSIWSLGRTNATDPSASSASVNSAVPTDISEAESYATRHGPGGASAGADYSAVPEAMGYEDGEEGDEGSELSDDDGEGAAGHLGSRQQQDVDSMADASPEEVEARAMELLGWNEMGEDKPLLQIDLERWKNITDAHTTEGTEEYGKSELVISESFVVLRCGA